MISPIINRIFKPNIEKLRARWDLDGLTEALNHKDYRIRKKAAEALGEMGAKEAIDALIKALKDENYEVRKTAAHALGKIRDAKAIKPLIEALNDESMEVRLEAVKSLKRIGYTEIKDLERVLTDILSMSEDREIKGGFKIPFFKR